MTTNLNAEVARAEAAEQANAQAIADEVAARTTKDAEQDGALAAEVTRATAAEAANAAAIAAEETRATAAEAANAAAIAAEEAARIAAIDEEHKHHVEGDAALQANLDAEAKRASEAEAVLTADLAEEVKRANEAEAALDADIKAEVARATSKDAEHDAAIAAEEAARIAADNSLTADLAEEVKRASEAEAALDADIKAEVARATALDAEHDALIKAETDARIAADASLQSTIDQVYSEQINYAIANDARFDTEKARAMAAEEANANAIATILDGSTVDLDQFKEIVDFVEAIDLENDNELLAAISNINTSIADNVAQLENADSAILDELSAHKIANDADFAAVNNNLQVETDARIAAINTLSDSFDAYKDQTDTEFLDVNTAIGTEADARIAGDAALQAQIDSDVAALTAKIDADIAAEQAARIAGDEDLNEKVEDIISNTDVTKVDSFQEAIDKVNEIGAKNFDSIYSKKVGVTFDAATGVVSLSSAVKPESMMLYINGLLVENGSDYTEEVRVDGMVSGATLSGDALDLANAGAKLMSYGVHGTFENIQFAQAAS